MKKVNTSLSPSYHSIVSLKGSSRISSLLLLFIINKKLITHFLIKLEFHISLIMNKLSDEKTKELKETFDFYDKDQDGCLDIHDL